MFIVRINGGVLNTRLKYLLNRYLCSAYFEVHRIGISSLLSRFINNRDCNLQSVILHNNFKTIYARNYREFSNQPPLEDIDAVKYESVCSETLDSLCEFFEDIIEKYPVFKSADVSFGDGVLTVNLDKFGTYVINRQSPNKQIWLSSPTSGPKRYDFQQSRNGWVYRHDNETLHSLLEKELSAIINSPVDLSGCAFCGDH